MPCMQMKELEASCARYDERRSKTAKRQIGQAQMAYVMQQHAKNCSECHRDRAKG
jgi:mono/diheme cytochrome c family protein